MICAQFMTLTPGGDRERAGNGAPGGDGFQRDWQTVIGESRRVDPLGEFSKFLQGTCQFGAYGCHEGCGFGIVADAGSHGGQIQRKGNEPLLSSVMEVPLQAAALRVPDLDDPFPRPLSANRRARNCA
jgi:hypothetical protein